jgi:hypothetical protein
MFNDEDGALVVEGVGLQDSQCFLNESSPIRGIHENEIKNLSFSVKVTNCPFNLPCYNMKPVIEATVRKILFDKVDG